MPRKIVVIRHAEKPDDAGRERGLDVHGMETPRGLTVRGWQRAGALVRFFDPLKPGDFADARLETPSAIFAVKPHESSERPLLTVQPLAQQLGLAVQAPFASDEVAALGRALAAITGVVLVCWRHGDMPALAAQLSPAMQPAPTWDPRCFDQAWVFTGSDGGYAMSRLPQRLLPGDSATA